MNKNVIAFLGDGLGDLVTPRAPKFVKVPRRSAAGYLGLASAYLSIGFNQVLHDEKEASKESHKRIEIIDKDYR